MGSDHCNTALAYNDWMQSIAARFAVFPQVTAVALGGSEGAGETDTLSDIDLYVYADAAIPVEARRTIAGDFADRIEIDNRFWEPGDEWIDRASGRGVDTMYRTPAWIEDQLARVLERHEASVGYSTCFWWNVLRSRALYDPTGWYANLQQTARQSYPAELRRAIVAKNFPILRDNISSYRHQIEAAIKRGDWIGVHHRVNAFLASYWDILFAVNGVPHPGEKRIAEHARRLCKKLPPSWEEDMEALLRRPALAHLDRLTDGLEQILGGANGHPR
jgi:hypothetical protein